MFTKIASHLRISTEKTGTDQTYNLTPTQGGSKAKTAQYAIAVLARSSANCSIGAALYHGPTPALLSVHTGVLMAQAVVGTPPEVRIVDADDTSILCEFLQLRITVQDNATGVEEWAIVDVYEMLKPF